MDNRAAAVDSRRPLTVGVLVGVMLVAAILVSLSVGRYSLRPDQIWSLLGQALNGRAIPLEDPATAVLLSVRLPRVLMAALAGAALAAAGAAFQGIFRNPMVSPDLLGVSSGASVGACLGILLSVGSLQLQLLSFVTAVVTVALVLGISSAVTRSSGGGLLVLVLAGIVVSSLASALTSLAKYLAPTDTKLPEITFWLMGSFARSGSWGSVSALAISFALGGIPLLLLRSRINVLAFGDDEAKTLGIDPGRTRLVIILAATLLTATTVALCGVVGWVGLVIPHLCRLLVGANYRGLLPCSMIVGGLFMVLVDDLARSLTAGEIPLGVVTAFIGAPVFISLLFGSRESL